MPNQKLQIKDSKEDKPAKSKIFVVELLLERHFISDGDVIIQSWGSADWLLAMTAVDNRSHCMHFDKRVNKFGIINNTFKRDVTECEYTSIHYPLPLRQKRRFHSSDNVIQC